MPIISQDLNFQPRDKQAEVLTTQPHCLPRGNYYKKIINNQENLIIMEPALVIISWYT
jgi:hypothetical protein